MSGFFRALVCRSLHPLAPPIRLGRRPYRLYILPTRAGLLYALTLMAMLLTAINYTLALGYALVFLLASLAFIAMLYTHGNLAGLTLDVQEGEAVFAGESARFNLLVETPSTPRPALEFSCQGGEKQTIHLNDNAVLVALSLPAPARGWFALPRLKVSSRYPLGLFRAWSSPWLTGRCLVYPKPVFSPLPEAVLASESDSGRGETGEDDFAGFRERQASDSLRHVAWKAAARSDGHAPLLVKRFSGGALSELWLDWELTKSPQNNVETRLSILAGWVVSAEKTGISYGFSLPTLILPPNRGAAHYHRCLKALAIYPETAA